LTDIESIDAYLEDKDPVGVDLFRRFQQLVEECGPSDVAPRRTIVYWKWKRTFAGAWIERRRLELNINIILASSSQFLQPGG
jgi:hypothetical protein